MMTTIIAILILISMVLEIAATVCILTLYAFAMYAVNDGFITSDLIKKL